jgi:hypothetical protein
MSPESYITTDGQSASLSWNKAPIWSLRPDLYYCQTVAGLIMWDALTHKRTGLSFTIADGPRQLSHSRVRVTWDSRPYFTVCVGRLYTKWDRTEERTICVTPKRFLFSPRSLHDLYVGYPLLREGLSF